MHPQDFGTNGVAMVPPNVLVSGVPLRSPIVARCSRHVRSTFSWASHYMNFRFLKILTSSGDSANHSLFVHFAWNRLCQ